ncbi:alkyl sulfatase dimerization domain-containing protein [Ilumatobacter sp.]|uniref:alkyl sulfatase dimerization domain-containing protein n=1 Tax=Ilumatobacter sp. TaxID=1967498 RepID=UPI003AF9684D
MSLRIDRSVITTGPNGAVAHRDLIDHSARFERHLHRVGDGVWCRVGGGLSNITFIDAPDGLIVVDSGECREEAEDALAALRQVCDRPLAAMIWSHYHYVYGTAAYLDDAGSNGDDFPIWAHVDGPRLLAEMGAEVGPTRTAGLVGQFGLALPTDGPDSMPNVGLGPYFKDPNRPTTTPGYVPPNRTVDAPTDLTIAGERVVLTPVPSDSDDTLVIWLPDRGVCINNHLWPALFNIYPLRGEAYRDPTVLLEAFDTMLGHAPDVLVGVHGPPIEGAGNTRRALLDARDSIQFLWDQTVRHVNAGRTLGEIVERVQLPVRFRSAYYTTEFYGMAQHHVRQIHGGVRGWFDGDAAGLFPLPEHVEAERIVTGFGGRDVVLTRAREALEADEASWSAQLTTYLLLLDADDAGARELKASALRLIAQSVTSANVRSWCLTQARELEGSADLGRFRTHHTSARRVLAAAPEVYVHALRVQLEPKRADFETCVRWRFRDSGTNATLRIRHGVAVPGRIDDPDVEIELDLPTWARLYGGDVTAVEAESADDLVITGDRSLLTRFFGAFDQPHLVHAFET